jgi:nitrogen fixation/metabolism regulation signal transduction histidine kinase
MPQFNQKYFPIYASLGPCSNFVKSQLITVAPTTNGYCNYNIVIGIFVTTIRLTDIYHRMKKERKDSMESKIAKKNVSLSGLKTFASCIFVKLFKQVHLTSNPWV